MTLDIIVPHYKEPWNCCKYLFDSIAMQRGVDLSEIRVLVINDGDESVLDETVFNDYPYLIEYHITPHGGVSAARNKGIDLSTADYLMFCDIDDGFLNNYALRLIFNKIKEGFDFCHSYFVEEVETKDGSIQLVSHNDDVTFVHGKVYRREFLIEKDLRFDEAMTVHEDGYFNSIVFVEAKNSTVKITTPIYLWMWNANSTVRKDGEDFVLKSYREVMRSRAGICDEYKRRGHEEEYRIAVCNTVLNSYYDFQKPSYNLPKNEKRRRIAEKAFKQFYEKYRKTFFNCTNREVAEVAQAARQTACKNGMLMEEQDLRTWLRHIENEVK